MKNKIIKVFSLPLLSLILLCCSQPASFVFLHEETGPIQTNCYLVYDARSKEAALIDVGGPIDSLITHIKENNLKLKYIFATHCHMDHIEGVPMFKSQFPDALVGYNQAEYEDFKIFREWMEENMDPNEFAAIKQHPDLGKWFESDLSIFEEPDVYLKDNQVYKLGNLKIRTFLSPGHSRGSICFHVEDALFSGDVLFSRQVGRTDLLGGSKQDIINSVRRLYAQVSDETKVYPGHGEFTDIGTEKQENEEVAMDSVSIKN